MSNMWVLMAWHDSSVNYQSVLPCSSFLFVYYMGIPLSVVWRVSGNVRWEIFIKRFWWNIYVKIWVILKFTIEICRQLHHILMDLSGLWFVCTVSLNNRFNPGAVSDVCPVDILQHPLLLATVCKWMTSVVIVMHVKTNPSDLFKSSSDK